MVVVVVTAGGGRRGRRSGSGCEPGRGLGVGVVVWVLPTDVVGALRRPALGRLLGLAFTLGVIIDLMLSIGRSLRYNLHCLPEEMRCRVTFPIAFSRSSRTRQRLHAPHTPVPCVVGPRGGLSQSETCNQR